MPTVHHKYIEVGILGFDIYTFVRQYWSSEPAGDKKREYSTKVHNFWYECCFVDLEKDQELTVATG